VGKIISFSNQKGGVGKTTSAVNVAASLGKKGKKILLIDLDSQGNATSGLGISRSGNRLDAYDLILGETDAKDAVISTEFKNLDMIPSSIDLAGAEIELASDSDRNMRLSESLASVRDLYDYIIIDCPPSLGAVTVNALCASDGVVIPMTCEYYSLEGLSGLTMTIRQVKNLYNSALDITCILITMYDKRLNIARQVLAEIERYYSDKLFKTTISRNVRLAEAPSYGKPVAYYDRYSLGALAYDRVAAELIKRI